MNVKHILVLALLTTATLTASAVHSHTFVESDSLSIKVDFISNNIVRVKTHSGAAKKSQPSLVADIASAGFEEPTVTDTRRQGGTKPLLESKTGIQVLYNPDSKSLGFFRSGKLALYSECGGRGNEIVLTTMTRCSYYGGGERGYSLNLAGDTLVNYNRQNYGYTEGDRRIRQMGITMPYVVSSNGFAVFFDDFCASQLTLSGNDITYTTESDADIDYYVIFGSMENIVSDFTRLVGRQDIPPFWSLGYITSRYKFRKRRPHKGIDIGLNIGDPIYAAFDGVVRAALPTRMTGGYGNVLVIRHLNGLETYYGHLSDYIVESGDIVKAGELIGYGGSTGHSTGPHLHFETRYMGQAFDPERIFDFERGTLRSETFLLKKHYFSINSHYGMSDRESEQASKKKPVDKSSSSPAKYYKVKKGDTLNKIARRNNTTVKKLCQLNKIKENKPLQIGQRIRVK